jgi:hypothetical protein
MKTKPISGEGNWIFLRVCPQPRVGGHSNALVTHAFDRHAVKTSD